MSESLSSRLEGELSAVVEQRRKEIVSVSGGLRALEEVREIHKSLVDDVRLELSSEINSGRITHDVANYVMRWVNKFDVKSREYQDKLTSSRDIKLGETRAYESVQTLVRMLEESEQDELNK